MTVAEFLNKAVFGSEALRGVYDSQKKSLDLYLAMSCDATDRWLLRFNEIEERVIDITVDGITEKRYVTEVEEFIVHVAVHRRKEQAYPKLEELIRRQSGLLLGAVV